MDACFGKMEKAYDGPSREFQPFLAQSDFLLRDRLVEGGGDGLAREISAVFVVELRDAVFAEADHLGGEMAVHAYVIVKPEEVE